MYFCAFCSMKRKEVLYPFFSIGFYWSLIFLRRVLAAS